MPFDFTIPIIVLTCIVGALLLAGIALQVYCIVNIARHGVRNMNKAAWITIVACSVLVAGFGAYIGGLCYILIGAKRTEESSSTTSSENTHVDIA